MVDIFVKSIVKTIAAFYMNSRIQHEPKRK